MLLGYILGVVVGIIIMCGVLLLMKWNKWEIIEPQTIVIQRETLKIVEVYNHWWVRFGRLLNDEPHLINVSFRQLSFYAEHTVGDVHFIAQGTYLGTPEAARWQAQENLKQVLWIKWEEELKQYFNERTIPLDCSSYNKQEKEGTHKLMFQVFLTQKWPELNIQITKVEITFNGKKEV